MSTTIPGRTCPLDYRYAAASLATASPFEADTLYVVGGLYGNLAALDEIERMAQSEIGPVTLVFNGDFNWFNVDDAGFAEVNRRVLAHRATAGNVEVELARDDGDAGCGCAYPPHVDDATVTRSNAIHARLRRTAGQHPEIVARLAALPRHARCTVSGLRVVIVHGDAESLAGWTFDVDALADPKHAATIARQFAAADADVFACSHTCLPVLRSISLGARSGLIANNGAAGMPNFRDSRFGVITRISRHVPGLPTLYGAVIEGVHVDALAVNYEHSRFAEAFLTDWPEGSPAHESYWPRIAIGTGFDIARAKPGPIGAARESRALQPEAVSLPR